MEYWNSANYILSIYQISQQWSLIEFSKILHKPSEVLHTNPIHEVVKCNFVEGQQRHHVVGILIFHIP